VYQVGVVADKDQESKIEQGWESELLKGVLERDKEGNYSIKWETRIILISQLNAGGRGMELSELVNFNNRLLTFDDRTGTVFEIIQDKPAVIPLYTLKDGDGTASKGFKAEWGTVKDDVIYVGGPGREWTNSAGEIVNHDAQWVKVIDLKGHVENISWVHVYQALRVATGTEYPGYLIHESVRFHPLLRRWFFLPRRASKLAYDGAEDEKRGTNLIITTNEEFGDIKVSTVGPLIGTHGFSSFVFLPGREDELAALKSVEVVDVNETYITVFNLDGRILLPETKIGDVKFVY